MNSFLRFAAYLTSAAIIAGSGPPASAQGEACTLDPGPAATLLLPYFEVDLATQNGATTLFSIINTEPAAVLARVTLWSDLGIPTFPFTIYLTGYDVETVNLRDVLDGRVPRTASAAQDPADTISPQGDLSSDAAVASCDGFLPAEDLPAAQAADLKAEHRGQVSVRRGNLCVGANHGDGVARGYVTIDTVNGCSAKSPADSNYFGTGGEATNLNVLWGDYFYVDPFENAAQGEALVRIQAFPGHFVAGQKTFYGSLHGGSVADQREPLALSWASRFLSGGTFDGGTEVVVWQDPGAGRAPFACTSAAPILTTDSIVIFDEEENAEIYDGACDNCDPPPPLPFPFTPFPWVASRVAVGGSQLPVAFDFGYLLIGLGSTPPRQSWVGAVMTAEGRFGVGFASNPLDSACATRACPSGVCAP